MRFWLLQWSSLASNFAIKLSIQVILVPIFAFVETLEFGDLKFLPFGLWVAFRVSIRGQWR